MVTPNVKEITWSLGPGSHRLRLGKEVRDVCRKWVAEAEVMEEESQQTSPGYLKDLTEVQQGRKNSTMWQNIVGTC